MTTQRSYEVTAPASGAEVAIAVLRAAQQRAATEEAAEVSLTISETGVDIPSANPRTGISIRVGNIGLRATGLVVVGETPEGETVNATIPYSGEEPASLTVTSAA